MSEYTAALQGFIQHLVDRGHDRELVENQVWVLDNDTTRESIAAFVNYSVSAFAKMLGLPEYPDT